MDKLAKQTFTQMSREQWSYQFLSKNGKSYKASYEIKPFGYCEELFYKEGVLAWSREFKVGEFIQPSVYDIIANDI